MLASVFLVGSFWFWTLLVASFILVVFMAEVWDAPFWAAATVIATLVALDLLGDAGLWSWVLANPLLIGAGAGVYVVGGTLWSFVKWYIFVRKRREGYLDQRAQFMVDHKLEEKDKIPPTLLRKWQSQLSYSNREMPSARKEKSRILRWMVYWPWSVIYSLFADLVREVFLIIYARMATTFQRISESIYGDISGEMKEAAEFSSKSEKEQEKLISRWKDHAAEVIAGDPA